MPNNQASGICVVVIVGQVLSKYTVIRYLNSQGCLRFGAVGFECRLCGLRGGRQN